MAKVQKIAQELEWDFEQNTAYGTYKGFSMSLYQKISYTNQADNFKVLYVPLGNVTQGNAQVLHDHIQANKKQLRVFNFQVVEGLVWIRFVEGFKQINGERLLEILELLSEGLTTAGLEPKTSCAYCDQEETDTITYINNVKLPAHSACKEQAIEHNRQLKQQANQASANNAVGYVGAVVGAIVGAIPYAVAVWFGWYVGLLTFLTGLASYEGFKYLGGRATKATKFIIGLISLIVVLLSNVALMGVIALQYDVTIADVLSVPEMQSIFLESLAMSGIFGLLGIGVVVSRIKKDEFDTTVR